MEFWETINNSSLMKHPSSTGEPSFSWMRAAKLAAFSVTVAHVAQ